MEIVFLAQKKMGETECMHVYGYDYDDMVAVVWKKVTWLMLFVRRERRSLWDFEEEVEFLIHCFYMTPGDILHLLDIVVAADAVECWEKVFFSFENASSASGPSKMYAKYASSAQDLPFVFEEKLLGF